MENIVNILKDINKEYEINSIKEENKSIRTKISTIDLFDVPMIAEDNFVIGGCPREITFRENGFPVSDLDLYKIEKRKKDNFILFKSLDKFINGIKNKIKDDPNYSYASTLDVEYENLIDTKRECLEPFRDGFVLKDKKNNKITMFFYYLVQSDKEFREPNNLIVMRLMPAVINLINKQPNYEVVVILKHVHSFVEKPIVFNTSEYLDSRVLVIDNVPTSFDVNKYNKLIEKTGKEINELVAKKEFSDVKNLNKCTECLYKRFCDTLP